MKLTLLAAAATLVLPAALAAQTAPQTTPAPADPSTTAPADSTAGQPPQPGATDQAQTAPSQTAPTDTTQPMSTGTPAGGYQPNGSGMQGTMQPGVQPTYQAAPSPSQAYPAPAPKDSYPVCKKGQYDGCMEPGGANGGTHKMRHHKK